MFMTEREIVYEYNAAKYPLRQIQVLADLNQAEPEDIVELLERNGVTVAKRPSGRRPQPPSELLQKMYEAGMTDAAIARELGCSKNAIWRWRERRELPANIPWKLKGQKVIQMFLQGYTEQEIAEALSESRTTIHEWRRRYWAKR